ncbi:hypothetical protein ACIPX0_42930 [Streptomyces sp. NPDC090075]|uniref:hypothetical protein n=1 Tax=Streptomyces sp. NPDC090075 TaxID=3365937 RepID=UPI003830E712
MREHADSHASSTARCDAHAPAFPRVLPWPALEGKPTYLITDHKGGYLCHLANDLEIAQLAASADTLDRARRVPDDPMSPYSGVRYVGIRLTECLTDALRVAESRGMRLVAQNDEGDHEGTHG